MPSEVLDGWPDPDPGQVRVLLLGTYHMDEPGLDEVNVDVDDVLSERRQAELRAMVEALAAWNPDRVAVERPAARAADVNEIYRSYRGGERAYDRETRIDPPHPYRDATDAECRSEVAQVGFRLADRLGLDRVDPVDHPTDIWNDELERLEERGFGPADKVGVELSDPDEHRRRTNERLAESTVLAYHRWLNREEQLAFNHRSMFGRYLRYGAGDNYGGPRLLAAWYERNLRMAHELWRALDAGDERVLLLVGSGHVRALRHLLGEFPMTCPVSPLPLLRPAAD